MLVAAERLLGLRLLRESPHVHHWSLAGSQNQAAKHQNSFEKLVREEVHLHGTLKLARMQPGTKNLKDMM